MNTAAVKTAEDLRIEEIEQAEREEALREHVPGRQVKVAERPILFSGAMVRAILAGRKTVTRRIVKVQPPTDKYQITTLADSTARKERKQIGAHQWAIVDGLDIRNSFGPYFRCPLGKSGDRLWVRETWRVFGGREYEYQQHQPSVIYRADDGPIRDEGAWRPSIFMPRWASRLTLEILSVRVERLQAITEADAIAEGIELVSGDYNRQDFSGCWRDYGGRREYWNSPIDSFHSAWDLINGKRATWDSNPWVWRIEFKRLEDATK